MLGVAIAAVGDELLPLAVGDAAAGDGVGMEQDAVARGLAVEGEGRAVGTDLDQAVAAGNEGQRLGLGLGGRSERRVGRLGRVLGEGGEDVGQEQFLVLLLMLDPERDQRERVRREGRKRVLHRGIDRLAPLADLVEAGAADHPAPGPRMALALALVIAVEQERIGLVVEDVPAHMIAKHERFEEPGRMREVPFGGRGVGIRLDGGVGVAQRLGQRQRQRAGRREPFPKPSFMIRSRHSSP